MFGYSSHSKIFDCCIRGYFYVTVLLESIDLFIVLLKDGAVCTKY